MIAVDEAAEELLVTAVRLGHGGFVLTVAPLRGGRPGPERQLTLTAGTPVRKRGRARAWLPGPQLPGLHRLTAPAASPPHRGAA